MPSFSYSDALTKSFLFYEAQRSGALPANNRISWRRNSALSDANTIYDVNNNGVIDSGESLSRDLSGGYYDAGDHMKYAYPMASAMTLLSWGVAQYGAAYAQVGQRDEALDAVRWGTDWLLKAHETSGSGSTLQTVRLWGQVGRTATDHNAWVDDQRIPLPRPGYIIDANKPGADLAAEVAAAMASASVIFRTTDAAYANRLLDNARALFRFAYQYQGLYSNTISDAAQTYQSNNFNDDLAWGAIWLHKATKAAGGSVAETLPWAGSQTYLQIAKAKNLGLGQWTQSWSDKQYGTAVLLAQEDSSYDKTSLENWLNWWSIKGAGGVPYTNGGLAFLDQWGSLRYAANTAFLAGIYSDTVRDYSGRYANFAKSQIDYILGANPRNSSYMIGFGSAYSRNPHHANAHLNGNPAYNGSNGWTLFNNDTPSYNLLTGGLVGGPGSLNDFDYVDTIKDYQRNEVALDYNAALTGVLARLSGGGTPPSISLSSSQTVVEGSTAPQSVTYTVRLSNASNQTVTVAYTTVDGTALAGSDYAATSGTLTFAPGVTSQQVSISILNDAVNETNETFKVVFSNPANAALATSEVTTTLTDTLRANVSTTLPAAVENLILTGTAAIDGAGNTSANVINGNEAANQLFGGAGDDTLRGNGGNDGLNGGAGADTLIGGADNDLFVFQYGQSSTATVDKITNFVIGTDKIDLLTAGGAAMSAPAAMSRAANNSSTTVTNLINAVFADVNGALSGNQALDLNSAALVVATTTAIQGTYLVVNDGTAGFQSASDLVIRLTNLTGSLPPLGSVAVSTFFI